MAILLLAFRASGNNLITLLSHRSLLTPKVCSIPGILTLVICFAPAIPSHWVILPRISILRNMSRPISGHLLCFQFFSLTEKCCYKYFIVFEHFILISGLLGCKSNYGIFGSKGINILVILFA